MATTAAQFAIIMLTRVPTSQGVCIVLKFLFLFADIDACSVRSDNCLAKENMGAQGPINEK